MKRDMTKAQFQAALKRNGMAMVGWGGYVTVRRTEKSSLNVCRHNAGPNLRAQLAYLLQAQASDEAADRAAFRGEA